MDDERGRLRLEREQLSGRELAAKRSEIELESRMRAASEEARQSEENRCLDRLREGAERERHLLTELEWARDTAQQLSAVRATAEERAEKIKDLQVLPRIDKRSGQ